MLKLRGAYPAALAVVLLSCSGVSSLAKSVEGPEGMTLPFDGAIKEISSGATLSAEVSISVGGAARLKAQKASAGESDWSLPFDGKIGPSGKVLSATRLVQKQKEYRGFISAGDSDPRLSERVDELLNAALARDEKTKTLNKAVTRYRSRSQEAIAQGKDAFDYLIPFRGFGPSSEAGDVILDEKLKLKSRASAEFARQKHIDETHVKIVSSVMQLAMGLGMVDRPRGDKTAAVGMSNLKALVGDEEAKRTFELLTGWKEQLRVPESLYSLAPWDVAQRQDRFSKIVSLSIDSDPVVQEIKRRVHKYNQKNNLARASSKIIQTTLGAVSLTPAFVGPAAKTTLLAFVMATGGPEQCKIMKALYMDKRLESRCKVIDEETHLALDNYQLGVLTRNPLLLACSESFIAEMAGAKAAKEVLPVSLFANSGENAQI